MRKDKKPLKLQASLCYYSPNPSAAREEVSCPQLAQILEKNRNRNTGFDAMLFMQIPVHEHGGFGAAISLGMNALYRDILGINAPDRFFELISIEAMNLGDGTTIADNATPDLCEAQGAKLSQQLQAAGFTVQKIELRYVDVTEKATAPVFA